MVMPQLEQEPSADLNAYCIEVIRRWESGELSYEEAFARIATLSADAEKSGHIANLARIEHTLGYMYHYRGSLNLSLMHYERSRALYQKVGNRRRVAIMDMNMGESYRYKGDFARARRLFRAAYETFHALDDLEAQAVAVSNEGQVLLSMKLLDLAQSALEEGARLAESLILRGGGPQLATLLCEVYHGLVMIYLTRANPAAAWEMMGRALDIAYHHQQPMQLGFANRAAGEVTTVMQPPAESTLSPDPDEYFRAAGDAFRAINMEGELARTMLAQARSLAYRGRRTTAARKLQHVMQLFTELGMLDDAAKAAELQLSLI